MSMAKFGITYRGTVYPWQCDHMGHMNVMWYTGKFDEASWQFLASLGLTRARLHKENAGMAALEQHIVYKRELHAGDIVTIRSAVIEVKDKVSRIIHEMRNDETGEVAATATILAICLDAHARTARSLPSDVKERAEDALSCWEYQRINPEAELEFSTDPSDETAFLSPPDFSSAVQN
jgi:acyl-CoA thioester hydrolase